MNKKEFLNELRKKLKILKQEEIDDIIKEYEDNIEEKIKNGISEEEAIKNFGDIDELVKEILDAYKISSNGYQDSFENTIKDFVSKTSDWLKDLFSRFSDGSAEDILNIIFKILALFVLILILKIPFYIIKGLGIAVLGIFPSLIGAGLVFIWKFIVEIAYILVCIMLFVTNFSKGNTNKKIVLKKDKPTIIEEKTKEKRIKQDNNHSIISAINSVLVMCVKIFAIFLLLPFFGILIFILFMLGLGLGFVFNGIFIFGPLLIMVGAVIGIGAFISLILKLTFRKENN